MEGIDLMVSIIQWISLLFLIQMNFFPNSVPRLKTQLVMAWFIIIGQFITGAHNMLTHVNLWTQLMVVIIIACEWSRVTRLRSEIKEGRTVE